MEAEALWSERFVWKRLQKCVIMESRVRGEEEEEVEKRENSLPEQAEHERLWIISGSGIILIRV